MRRLRALAALGVALLGGCAGLGGTSPVRTGLEIGGQDVPRVRVFFPAPVTGAGPDQIVRGFLRSGAASDGDYDVARSFLTQEAARAWSPDGEVLVVAAESELVIEQVDEARSILSTPVVARISKEGRYSVAAPGEIATVEIRFARIDGEWRIADLPDDFGRWLTAADLRRLFQPYAVHYVATGRRSLVPDLRWFPLDHLTSRLAQAQLAPVPSDLEGVATTAVPLGARLTADSVSVQGGVATVELSTRPAADQVERQNLWAQFVATLTQDPSVRSVMLQVDGSPIDPPMARAPVADPAEVGFVAATPAERPGVLVRLADRLADFDTASLLTGADPTVPPERTDLPLIPDGWTDVAVAPDGQDVAAVSLDRSTLRRWRLREPIDVAPFAAGLTSPTFDSRDHLWVGSRSTAEGAVLFVISQRDAPARARPNPVRAPWLEGRVVVDVRVSPDGDRVAVLSRGPDSRVGLHVSGVVRGPQDQPVSLAEPVEFGIGLSDLSGLLWLGPTRLATLGTPPGGVRSPVVISLDGTVTVLPETPDAVSLTSSAGERQLIVRLADDTLLVRSGPLWVDAGKASEVFVPGR